MSGRNRLLRIIAVLHAWIGALGALFMLAVSISGIAIAFSAPLLNLETDAFPRVEARAASNPVALGELIERAQEAADDTFVPLGYLGRDAEIATNVEMVYGLSAPPDKGGEVQIVTFDAGSDAAGERTVGTFLLDRTMTHALIDFHYELLAGDSGATAVAVIGLLMTVLAIAGTYLWWPARQTFRHKLLTFRLRGSTVAKHFRLHSIVGFWASVVVIIWALSGVYWSKPDWLPGSFQPETSTLEVTVAGEFESASCEGPESVGINEAVTVALEQYPEHTVREAEFAAPWQGFHTLYLGTSNDVDKRDGDVRVWVSAHCPGQVRSATVAGIGTIGALGVAVHSGESFGALRVPVIVAVGLALALLSITGLVVWFRRYAMALVRKKH